MLVNAPASRPPVQDSAQVTVCRCRVRCSAMVCSAVMGLSFFNGGGFVGGGREIDYRSIANGGGRSSPTAFSDDLKDILFRTRLLPVLHQHNHQFAVVGYFDGNVFAAVRLQDTARPQFLPFSAVKQKYRAAFGLGNQQGVAGVVVAGDFLAFGQGFADD